MTLFLATTISSPRRQTFALQHGLEADRAQRRLGDLVDLEQHALQGAADVGVLARLLCPLPRRRLEQGDDVHESRATAIAREAIAARGAATAAHQAGVRQSAQNLREMVVGDTE